ncbi:MAG: YhgE/Pip family protein [Lawsonella clevelandensis]
MFASLNLGTELRRFRRSRLGKLAIIAICVIPLLYSTLYLWSFWDPFGKLNRVPVAFVNEDQGMVVAGQPFNAGDQIEDKIRQNDQLDWVPTNEEDAVDGVRNGKYYFAVMLPKNFSEEVASPTSDHPQKATVYTHYNDSNGWLTSLIGQNAMRVFLETVSSEIGQQAVDKLLVGVQEAGKGLHKATVGAQQLADGAVQLNDGTGRLQDASLQLDDGAHRLSEGSDSWPPAPSNCTTSSLPSSRS